MNRTICCLATAIAIFIGSPAATAASAVEEAQTLIEKGDLNAALKRLDAQLKGSPQDAEARFLRGLVLTRLEQTGDAIKAFADITRDYPQLPEPYNNLAVLYAQQGDYEKARDALEAALATNPSYATAHENLGDVYAALAGAAYNRALALNKENQGVRTKLSLLGDINKSGAATTEVAAAPAPKPAAPSAPTPAPAPVATPVAPVAPPAPAAAPAPAGLSKPVKDEVLAALSQWASAWSAQDVDAYLSTYSADFRPEGGVSRANWEALRRDRVARPSMIRVEVLRPELTAIGESIDQTGDRVRLSFRQEYESNSFADVVTKVLELKKESGGWKITREYTR